MFYRLLSLQENIREILLHLGIHKTLRGYFYLRDAIELVYHGAKINSSFYGGIASKNNTNLENVYKSIRICMQNAQRRNPTFLATIMGEHYEESLTYRHTKKFISSLATWAKENNACLVRNENIMLISVKWEKKSE